MLKSCHWCNWLHCNIKPGYSTPWKEQKVEKMCKIKMNKKTHLLHIKFPSSYQDITSFSIYLEWLLAGAVFIKLHSSEIFFFFIKQITYQIKNGKLWKGENVNWKPDLENNQNNWEGLNKCPIHSLLKAKMPITTVYVRRQVRKAGPYVE